MPPTLFTYWLVAQGRLSVKKIVQIAAGVRRTSIITDPGATRHRRNWQDDRHDASRTGPRGECPLDDPSFCRL